MNLRLALVMALAFGLVGWLAGSGLADEEGPSEEEMMKKMIELATPGPFHDHLKAMAGDWTAQTVMFKPDGSTMEAAGSCSNEWVLGGRYLATSYGGSWGGMPFEGRGFMGYDNATQQFQGLWIDTFSTGFYVSTGTCSDDGKTITLVGEWNGAMGKMKSKDVYKILGPDSYEITGHMQLPSGDWQPHMKLTLTRKTAD